MEKLKFLETWTVEEFKKRNGVEKIEVKQNEATGKCFFAYGLNTGACSEKFERGEITMPVVSKVFSPETEDSFYLLHQKGEGYAITIETL